jgi:GTPase
MFGLVGLLPDYAMIIVGANMGVSRMTREHLGISLALGVPIFFVITKIDISPKDVYS